MNALKLNEIEKLARLRSDLRLGLPLGIEGGGAFAAIEHLQENRFRDLQSQTPLFVILSKQRALDLNLSHDPTRPAVLHLPKDYRFDLLRALADPAMDLDYPGKGPLAQGTLDVTMCNHILDFCRQSRTLPAVIFAPEVELDGQNFTPELWELSQNQTPRLLRQAQARVPLKYAPASQMQVYRELDNDAEHYALIIGGAIDDAPLVRLHSACFTGDCLGSLKCDCGPQLHFALQNLNHEGGVLLYLAQEGRGIGLPNKIRAYHLQDQGFDTVEANQKLGFEDDERNFRIGAEILKQMKINKVRLMTNNPRKINWLENSGIKVVERVPIIIEASDENQAYLATKAKKSGHLL